MDILFNAITDHLPQIITAVIGIGAVWGVSSKILGMLKEITELLKAVIVAFADRKLTQEEINLIVKEASDVKQVINTLIGSKLKRS